MWKLWEGIRLSEIDNAIAYFEISIVIDEEILARENGKMNSNAVRIIESNINSYRIAIQALEEKKQREWVPVSERLPDKSGFYLVQHPKNCDYKGMCTVYFYKGDNKFQGIHDDIEAWQVLPPEHKEASCE